MLVLALGRDGPRTDARTRDRLGQGRGKEGRAGAGPALPPEPWRSAIRLRRAETRGGDGLAARRRARLAVITQKQTDILAALARYGYLTVRQIQKLGSYSDRKSLYGALALLNDRKLVAGAEVPACSAALRFPGVYSLTALGAKEIGAATDCVLKPLRIARPGASFLDALQRTAIVDCHIALDAWAADAGHVVEHFIPDFAPSHHVGRRATAMHVEHGSYAPDAVALLACADGVKRPLVIEVYRGGAADRPGYVQSKLPDMLRMLRLEGVRLAMRCLTSGETAAPRLLIVAATDTLRDSLLDRPPSPELPEWSRVYIKTLGEIEFDFAGEWWRVPRRCEPLFSLREPAKRPAISAL